MFPISLTSSIPTVKSTLTRPESKFIPSLVFRLMLASQLKSNIT